MPPEHSETDAHSDGGTSNGASSHSAVIATARAAFLAGDSEAEAKSAPGKAAADVADDDSDLEDGADETSDDDVEEAAADDDADLDEDDDAEDEEEEADKAVDADTAKRLATVQKTDKRLREQRERDFKARETEIDAKVREYESHFNAELEKLKPRIEAAESFEKLKARASIDPVAVLQALGVKEDVFEHTAQVLYTLAKAKDDPKARAAAAQLMKTRERDAEIEDLKKWREQREQTDKEREQQAAADRQVEAFIGSVTKAVGDKTPLAKALMKNDPDGSREELQVVAFRLAKESGKLPDAKAVAIAFEKAQRAKLRKLGIDPKSRGAAAAIVTDANTDSKTKTTPKTGEKKLASSKTKVDELKPLTRDDFIHGRHRNS